ncbi:MAG: hypothetical protein MJE66_21070 [Proteobacteria bacterium]|nr:hypothetical protein [Pseudomonadota bacterium]
MKKALIGLVVALLLIAGGVYFALTNLDGLVARLIEEEGSRALGTSVRVGGVQLDLAAGRGTVTALQVRNPDGFSDADLFALDGITLDIDLESLGGDPIVIDELRIRDPRVHFEVNATGRNNLSALGSGAGGSASSEGAGGDEAAPTRLRIRRLRFEDGRITALDDAISNERLELKLASFELRDVGGRRGATPAELGARIAQELGRRTTQQVAARTARKRLEKTIDEQLEGPLGEAAKGLLDRIGGN